MSKGRSNATRIMLAVVGGALSAGSLHAIPERYWNNTFGGAFISSANWNSPDPGDPIPGSANYAIFNLASTYTVTLSANRTVNQLMGRLGAVTFNLGGFTMTTNNVWVADEDGNQAQFTISNGRIISDGGFVGANFMTTATLNQTGSMQWQMSDDLSVGEFGAGTFNMLPGATLTGFGIFIGTGSTGVGIMNMEGANTRATITGDVFVGYLGEGTLNITNGADVVTPQLNVATIAGASGEINVSGAGSTLSGGVVQWNIGNSGHGVTNITDGGVVSSSTSQLGSGSGSLGECLISGDGSRWTSSGSFYPGRGGMGFLTVENSGELSAAASVVLGLEATGYGEVLVQSGGSISAQSQLQIGREGEGVMTILAQSSVTSSGVGSPTFTAGYLGGLAGSSGTLSISGANAEWIAESGSAVIGFGGEGYLTIGAAGQLQSAGGFVGRNPGSFGSVTISGNSARWNSTGGVSVGVGPSGAPGGSGIMTVNGQGKFVAPVLNVGAGGTISGDGEYQAAITNSGVVAPGNPGNSAGTLSINGDYTQTIAGDLEIQIGSAGFDKLSVTNAANLNGVLVVSMIGNYNPPDGQVFEILNASSVSGAFSTAMLPTLPGGRTFSVSYTNTAVRLTVGEGGPACPADVDGDGFIGFSDLNVVISQFNTSGPNLQGDVNGDGEVNFADLNAVISLFNTDCE